MVDSARLDRRLIPASTKYPTFSNPHSVDYTECIHSQLLPSCSAVRWSPSRICRHAFSSGTITMFSQPVAWVPNALQHRAAAAQGPPPEAGTSGAAGGLTGAPRGGGEGAELERDPAPSPAGGIGIDWMNEFVTPSLAPQGSGVVVDDLAAQFDQLASPTPQKAPPATTPGTAEPAPNLLDL